jgi:hypothetical protein
MPSVLEPAQSAVDGCVTYLAQTRFPESFEDRVAVGGLILQDREDGEV